MTDNVIGLHYVAEENRAELAKASEEARKAHRRLIDSYLKTLPKSERTAAKNVLIAFFECWGNLPAPQRRRWIDATNKISF